MAKQLIKGNEAVIKGAILAGCRAFFGYPITPASEIAEAAANYFQLVGGTFIQAESEIGSINMVYGAASAGIRAMTASSSPGISLKMEGVSYMAGAELPCVVVNINRGGPGLGNIAPEQSDYNQLVKGGGHGNYKVIVLAPASAQEMCDLTMLAFELADKYRNPVFILADGYIGQMMEAVDFPEPVTNFPEKEWAVRGDAETRKNLITSIYLDPDELEEYVRHLESKYRDMEKNEVRFEAYYLDDAELVIVCYGIVARIAESVVNRARAEGHRVGLLRPVTLFPFPSGKIEALCDDISKFLVVEMSTGQMVDDVRLAVNGRKPIELYTRIGGNVPSEGEIYEKLTGMLNVEKEEPAAAEIK